MSHVRTVDAGNNYWCELELEAPPETRVFVVCFCGARYIVHTRQSTLYRSSLD